MIHFAFLIHLISVATGYSAVIISLLFYFKQKKQVILFHMFFLFSLLFISTSLAVDHYLKIIKISSNTEDLVTMIISAIGSVMCVLILPPFIHNLSGIKYSKIKNYIFMTLDIILIISTILYFVTNEINIMKFILQPILFGTIGYSLLFIFFTRKKIGNQDLKKSLRPFMIVILIYFPLMVADAFLGTLPFLPYNLSVPLFFLSINDVGILFIIGYLNQPAFLKNDSITEHFIEKFNISKREIEVIESLMLGKSNKEIAGIHCISPKTVENHLSNIYSKTTTKNRFQLISLLQSNKSLMAD